jgi:quercetin dioxygenase-like cupin family protein
MAAFEVWDDPSGQVRFCFSYAGTDFTTGVMVLRPGAILPKHNRPQACEDLLQLQGACRMTLLDETGAEQAVHELRPNDSLSMKKGQWHIHANPTSEESFTLFKAEGDISGIVEALRKTFVSVEIH